MRRWPTRWGYFLSHPMIAGAAGRPAFYQVSAHLHGCLPMLRGEDVGQSFMGRTLGTRYYG